MKYVIGVDLGGTTVKGGLVDEKGNIVKRYTLSTAKTKAKVLSTIVEVINFLDEKDVIAIGIGSPGHIDSERGCVTDIGGNIEGWANTDIRGYIKKNTRFLDVFVENDANCAGLCESWMGRGKDIDYFVMITLGTGMGGVVISDGRVFNGGRYAAGEFGHTVLYPNGRKCSCGQNGCAETYTSGNGLENTYLEMAGSKLTGPEIMNLSVTDKTAKAAVNRYAFDLSLVLVNIKNLFAPRAIIIGGGVINSKEYWWDTMMKGYCENVNVIDDMQIISAKFLNDSGIIGASYLAFTKFGDKYDGD